MRLISLQLMNFRQFFGLTPKLKFADGQDNVTVIHGANGSGKTALLNGFTWLFYNRFTDAFAAPDFLVNRKALASARIGQAVECWVELTFEHGNRRYVLRRTKRVTKTGEPCDYEDDSCRVSLDRIESDGHLSQVSTDEIPDVIGRILPDKLMPYFFFDGERIESLQRANRRADVISATTMLVGEEVLSRAIDHLDGARKRIEANLKQIGDAETSDLLERKEQIESEMEQVRSEKAQREANIEGFRRQKEAIDQDLRALASVQELQKRRDLLTEQQRQLEQSEIAGRTRLRELISGRGYQAYLQPAISKFRTVIDSLRKKGELPSSIKHTFVRELLEAGRCICGRPLHRGDQPYIEVEGWLERGGMSDVEEVALRMEAEIDAVEREAPRLFGLLDQTEDERRKIREQLSRIEGELDQIKKDLKGSPVEQARDLERRREEIEEDILDTQRRILENERQLKDLQNRCEQIQGEIDKHKAANEAQQIVKSRLSACREARDALIRTRERLRSNFREDLGERINSLFSRMSFKPYKAAVAPDYSLELVDATNGTPVGPGTGESALLSLSFVGAVISQARDLTAARDRLPGPDSSVFPVVMDSPFGNLDPIYRRQVAKNIPEIANQVVIMVSKTQFQGEVETTIEKLVGKEYVLRYYSPKRDAQEDQIQRHGVPYDLVKRIPEEHEYTEVVEVMSQ
ncbi:MAG: AAA family ATPase [Ignavibacteriales bacterium]